ncbi:hypothetical protein C8R44DRAFT_731967 [Mycena epipterygia]|nr:hypothetical protein C8R44DRAFT_731967 [Mycena epipterygia]
MGGEDDGVHGEDRVQAPTTLPAGAIASACVRAGSGRGGRVEGDGEVLSGRREDAKAAMSASIWADFARRPWRMNSARTAARSGAAAARASRWTSVKRRTCIGDHQCPKLVRYEQKLDQRLRIGARGVR